ncbi:MAG: N-acetylmuramoyl-L-alanine amidase [Muribaculaceae bacterium]|nr:N-acetylmuramoyl-L-alanine amidase [Muribaculaceae bacterium]
MRHIDKIIIHCSATESGRDFYAKDIDVWHRARGFNSIGYHYVITLAGSVETGRDERLQGAHCLGQNGRSIGICYIGGLKNGVPADTRTPAQKKALKELVAMMRARYPGATVHGHREFANKACPCFDVGSEFRL